MAKNGTAKKLSAAIALMVSDSDVAVGNLEGPLTCRPPAGPPWRFTLHGDPKYALVLRDAGLNVVSLANNHIMDYGWEAVEETQQLLSAAGIRSVGAGRDLKMAREPVRMSVRGVRVAFLAYCDVPSVLPIYADSNRPGVAPAQPSYILEDIKAAKQESNLVLVCMHWGQEHVHFPAPKYRRLAKEMVAAGASLIVGHHPHVLQGVERIAQGAVAYSLGNFTFSEEDWRGTNPKGESFSMPYGLSEDMRKGAVWRIVADEQGGVVQEHLIPTYLRSDLCPSFSTEIRSKTETKSLNRGLMKHPYAVLWLVQMTASRLRVILDQLRGGEGIRKRLLRLRPRHLRDLVHMLAREWRQLRGMEQST